MYITDSQLSSNWSSSTRTMSKLLSRGVGGGGRGYSTNISEEESRWRFETLTMFRTKIFRKYLPCFGQNPQFYNPALDKGYVHRLGQTCEIAHPIWGREVKNTIPSTHPLISHKREYPPPRASFSANKLSVSFLQQFSSIISHIWWIFKYH